MTLLPIVGRELRVAARKRSTFWLRIAAALVALFIGGAVMILVNIIGTLSAGVGGILFNVLTWLSFAAALSAGLFFTSDCLSEEKREGTLGFLFLTDLRGYDVVAGKLLATSLRCFYGLLAIFPILAVTLLIGGVTGAQFSKTLLALFNALFCSLAAGMFVSALSRDAQKAMLTTLLLILLLVAGGPLADASLGAMRGKSLGPWWSLSSAWYVFRMADAWGATPYWQGLFISQGVAWVLLALACALVPRTWQDKGGRRRASRDWAYSWKYGGLRRRQALRRKLLDFNPVMWLACRERWQALVVWSFAILMSSYLAFFALSQWSSSSSSGWQPALLMGWSSLGWVTAMILYVWLASQASRFFLDARRAGLIELLLVSPVEPAAIVRGQWKALARMFGFPLIILLAAQFAGTCLGQYATRGWRAGVMTTTVATTPGGRIVGNSTNGTAVATPSGTNATLAVTNSFVFNPAATSIKSQRAAIIATAVITAVTSLANFIALTWFGMWMGMTSKNNNLATLKSIVFVQIVPLLISYFMTVFLFMMMMIPSAMSAARSGKASRIVSAPWFAAWLPFIYTGSVAILSLAKDVGFTLWARRKLRSSFREQAAQGTVPIRFQPSSMPPAIPPPIAPPVVAAQP